MKWNTSLYDEKHSFVSKYGEDLLDLLAPQEGEWILDIGCGTGDLTEAIKRRGANVVGLDSSEEMIAAAGKKYPGIRFDLKSADNFSYDRPYDAVFSNATLHWVLNSGDAVRCMYKALKPGGRLVAEFGGRGNVDHIMSALRKALRNYGHTEAADKRLWYFPSLSQYASLLEENGFRVVFASHFDRPTLLKDKEGIRNWLRMFGETYLEAVDPGTLEPLLKDIEERIRPTNFLEGNWYADYVRLRVVATKQ